MATISKSKLNALFQQWPTSAPLASKDLATLGISPDLAVHYAKAGWLVRLAHAVYQRPGESLALKPCLKFLERKFPSLHVGGKTALDWYGIRQYVSQRPVTQLYGWNSAKLPTWFTERFPAEYHRKRLFVEKTDVSLHVSVFDGDSSAPQVSEPERGLLEMLSEVGVRQSLAEAGELTQSTQTLRSSVLETLLASCTSVKTVRLCLHFGREYKLPWARKLDPRSLPLGALRPWVSRLPDGLLVLKR